MTLLPTQGSTFNSWVDIDRRIATLSVTQAGGVCLATFDQVPLDQQYLIERVAITNTSSSHTSCYLYNGPIEPNNVVDYSKFGNSDIADENSPILVPANSQLQAQWVGGNNGDIATITIQYRVQKQRSNS